MCPEYFPFPKIISLEALTSELAKKLVKFLMKIPSLWKLSASETVKRLFSVNAKIYENAFPLKSFNFCQVITAKLMLRASQPSTERIFNKDVRFQTLF